MQTNRDEIDLIELLAKLTLSIKNNIKLLLAAFIIGSSLGLIYYQFTTPTYESKLTITSTILTEGHGKSLFENIQKLLREKNIGLLSRNLSINETQARSIGSIEVKDVIERGIERKESEKIYLNVVVKSSDNAIWPDLQKGIISFLESNEFVKVRIEQKKNNLKTLISKVDKELQDLETLKERILSGKFSAGKETMVMMDPTTVNVKILDLTKEKLGYQGELELVNSVQIVEDFTVFKKPVSPKLSISLVAGSSLGIFFVLAIIGYKSLRKLVNLSEKKLADV